MMTLAGQAPDAVAGPARPLADPGRPLELKGALDQVVAAGFGLDLAALNAAAKQTGMVAALAGTDVVVAADDGAGAVTVAALRATLDAELGRVAAAARAPATKDGADKGVAAGPRDPLDALIAAIGGDERTPR